MKKILIVTFLLVASKCFTQNTFEAANNKKFYKNAKSYFTKDAIKLLKSFDTIQNINSGITTFIHKGIKHSNPKTSTYFIPSLGIGGTSTTPSTAYLTIFRFKNGTFGIAMEVFYVFSSTATSKIEQVSSYTFKWEKSSYTISSNYGQNLMFYKVLDNKDFEMFTYLSKCKNAEVEILGTNSIQEVIILSKHDLAKIRETLELFHELTI